MEGPALSSNVKIFPKREGMINEYEEEKERREYQGIFDLVPVPFRHSKYSVHSMDLITTHIVTKTKKRHFRHKNSGKFPPNKRFIT